MWFVVLVVRDDEEGFTREGMNGEDYSYQLLVRGLALPAELLLQSIAHHGGRVERS